MTLKIPAKIAQATGLTRKGRLQDAVALIQQQLGRGPSAPGATLPSIQENVPSRLRKLWPAAVPEALPLPPPANGAAEAQQHVISRMSHYFDLLTPPAVEAPSTDPCSTRSVKRTQKPQGRFEARSFTADAGTRTYMLYIPSSYTGQRVPLIVMLHGCSQSPEDFASGTRMNDRAEEHGFLVAYPAQTSRANPAKCWNWFNVTDQNRDQGEPSLIAGLTRQVMSDFHIDSKRVYVAGLSAGGAAAAIMGQAYPDIYAAIGVHSGLACGAARDMPSAMAAMRQGGSDPIQGAAHPMPTIVFHGDKDHTVNHLNAAQVIAQSKAAGEFVRTAHQHKSAGGVSYTRTVHADRAGQSILENWTLHGAGHAWSGGSTAGSYTDPHGPDASREMVRFFLQHTRAKS